MNPVYYKQARDHLLRAFNLIAPNQEVRDALEQHITKFENRVLRDELVLQKIAEQIVLGLDAGDWIGMNSGQN